MDTSISTLSFVMTDAEKKLLLNYASPAKHYLEFGGGGSTRFILDSTQARVTLVESSPEWVEHMRSFQDIADAEKAGRLTITLVDIGPTGDWGRPVDESGRERYPEYSSAVFARHDSTDVDLVLVDGRFRVACALSSALHTHGKSVPILIHDFSIRPEYHVVLEYMDIEQQADTLVALRVKPNVSKEALYAAHMKYAYISA